MVIRFIQRFYVALIFIVLYAPIAVLIALSFNASKSRVIWGGFTLDWYKSLFQSSAIMDALVTTLLLGVLSALFATIIGTFAAIVMERSRGRRKSLMLGLTNIPLLNADIVTGIALMLLFVRFMTMGFGTMLIAHIVFSVPFVVLSVMPKLRQIDRHIYDAARDLGASPPYAFFKVVMPDLFPGVLTGFLLVITMSLDDFVITYFTKGPGINTISTMVYAEMRKGIKPELYALSTLLFLVVLILLFIVNRRSNQKNDKKAPKRL